MNSLPVTLPYTLITRSRSFSPQPNNSLIFQTLGEGYLNDHDPTCASKSSRLSESSIASKVMTSKS